MRVCTCLLLVGIFASAKSTRRSKPFSASGIALKAGTANGNKNLELVFRAPTVDSFTDFIQETVDILNIYEETTFKDLFFILDKETRNYNYKGCKFSELTENTDTKNFLTQALKTIRGKPVAFIKEKINLVADLLRDEKYDSSVQELLEYINSLYKTSKNKFQKVLSNLYRYRKTKSMTHKDLVQVVRDSIRHILFDHYTELDTQTRRELNARIERFWGKFKNGRPSDDVLNDIDADDVKKHLDASKHVMNEHRSNLKKDTQSNLNNKRESVVSKEGHEDIEEDEGSVESEELMTEYSDVLSSQQSFDTSNSIKLSQERQQEYNTQRYETLYTEEIAYKARTTKETEATGRHKSHRRPVTTPSYVNRTKKVEILRMNQDMIVDDSFSDLRPDTESDLIIEPKPELKAKPLSVQPQEQKKPDLPRSKSRHKNAHMFSQYDAVIDVQLDNINLLESLRMFAPAVGSRETEKYNKSMPQKSAVRRQAETWMEPHIPTTEQTPRYPTSSEPHYNKPVNDLRRNISPSNMAAVEPYMEEFYRHADIDNKASYDYINKRISDLETELKDLKEIREIRRKTIKNNTDVVKLNNTTDQRKDMKENKIEKLSNTHSDLKVKNVLKENNKTKSDLTNTETAINNTYSKPNETSYNTTNAIVIGTTTTSQVTNSSADVTQTKDINTQVTTDTVPSADSPVDMTTVMTAVSEVTAPVVYSAPTPLYYDYPDRRLDPFDHFNDGLDLNM